MRIHNLFTETQSHQPEAGDIVGFEFGDILIESRVVEHLDDGIVVEMDEKGQQYLTELLPLIPAGIWAAGAAWTAYDTWKSGKEYKDGKISKEQLAARVGTDVALTIVGGAVAKGAIKGAKFAWKAGKKVFAKGADDAVDAGSDAAKSLAKKAEAPKVDIAPKVKADAPVQVKPELKVVDTPKVKNPQIADLAPKNTKTTFKSKPKLAVDKGKVVKPKDPSAVKAPVIGKIDGPANLPTMPKIPNAPKIVKPKIVKPKIVKPETPPVKTPPVKTPAVKAGPIKAPPIKTKVKTPPPVKTPTVKPPKAKTPPVKTPKPKTKPKGKGKFKFRGFGGGGDSARFQTNFKSLFQSEDYVPGGLEELTEAEYQGRTVKLNKPMQGDVKKSKVYVKDPKTGNVKKVNFGHGGTSAKAKGEKTMSIKKSNPERRKSFRARHNCDNPGPKTKARYWSCRAW
jgi:hypothetical protein